MKMTNHIRDYLTVAVLIARRTDDPTDDELDSIVAAATCALAMIKNTPRGGLAVDRVMALVNARLTSSGLAS
jgi:hypothetical protein